MKRLAKICMAAIICSCCIKWHRHIVRKLGEECRKMFDYYSILSVWVFNQQMAASFSDILTEHNIEKVAIYGWGNLGKLLLHELEHSETEVAYIIDRQAKSIFPCYGKSFITLEEIHEMEQVDAVIVTATYFYNQIEENLKKKINGMKIISLEDLVYGIYGKK